RTVREGDNLASHRAHQCCCRSKYRARGPLPSETRNQASESSCTGLRRRNSGSSVRINAMTPATVCFDTQLRRTGRVIKSNPAPIPRGRGHELSNRLYEFLDVRIVAFEAALKFGQFGLDLPMCCQGFAHAHESAHDKDAHLYGA